MTIALSVHDWLQLLLHFLSLSLLAIGGAITTAPDMQRYLVVEQHWISDNQFTASIALSQAAPGPNLLFIALLGWYVGINACGVGATGPAAWAFGLMGALICMLGILVPSTTLTFVAARWAHKNRERLAVRAFKTGMAPIVIGLLASTGWILSAKAGSAADSWRLWLVTAVVTGLVWRTRIHILWLLGAGALFGAMGWV